jgi:methylated-DNA-protein-cysteine methyltransferase related protein
MKSDFKQRLEATVAQIPFAHVMTYGQLAALCGNPRAARIVGGIAHYGDPKLPWHRVVNKKGGLASGYHGGRHMQKQHLEAEGVTVFGEADSYWVDVDVLIWWPHVDDRRSDIDDRRRLSK